DRYRNLMSAQAIVWIAGDLDYMLLVRRCFRQSGVDNPIVLLTSAELGLSFLRMEDDNKAPLVIVTEISLPLMDGYEMLRRIKSDRCFSNFPVLWPATTEPVDAEQVSQFSAVHFIRKPGLDRIPALVKVIIDGGVPRR